MENRLQVGRNKNCELYGGIKYVDKMGNQKRPSCVVRAGNRSLCAKPIIDIVAVMDSYDVFPAIVARLEKIGFKHNGDQGIKEREVFKRLVPDDFMDYHFYVCPKDSEENRRQTIFRNALLNNKDIADEYGKLKIRLIEEVEGDRALYTDSKTDFILRVIENAIKEGAE